MATAAIMPKQRPSVFELAEQLRKLLAEAGAETLCGELPEALREPVADVVEALGQRVARRRARDPRTPFDLDDRLIELMDRVEEHHDQRSEISEELSREIDVYLEAYRQKVDRIAGFWRWKESIAAICGKEAERLTARKEAALARVKRLKGFVLAFMSSRGIRRLEGERASIGRQANSQASLVFDDRLRVPEKFWEKGLRVDRTQLEELVRHLPESGLRTRLRGELRLEGWEINEAAVRASLVNQEHVAGAHLHKGEHVRIR